MGLLFVVGVGWFHNGRRGVGERGLGEWKWRWKWKWKKEARRENRIKARSSQPERPLHLLLSIQMEITTLCKTSGLFN